MVTHRCLAACTAGSALCLASASRCCTTTTASSDTPGSERRIRCACPVCRHRTTHSHPSAVRRYRIREPPSHAPWNMLYSLLRLVPTPRICSLVPYDWFQPLEYAL
eukprot:3205882-Pyramimonas_sp.AAC.2